MLTGNDVKFWLATDSNVSRGLSAVYAVSHENTRICSRNSNSSFFLVDSERGAFVSEVKPYEIATWTGMHDRRVTEYFSDRAEAFAVFKTMLLLDGINIVGWSSAAKVPVGVKLYFV